MRKFLSCLLQCMCNVKVLIFCPALQVILPLGDDPKEKRNGLKAKQNSVNSSEQGEVVTGLTGEQVCIRRAPDLDAVRHALKARISLLPCAQPL